MTKAHPHRQVNVHLDIVDDADIIERIEAQPSMVGYIRELVRRDIHDERLDYAALKASELQAENAKLRELVRELWRTMDLLNACDVSEYDEPLNCIYCEQWGTVGKNIVGCKLKYRMRELGVEVDA